MMATLQEGGVVDRVWVGSGDNRREAWSLAHDFACVLRVLGVRAWKVSVRPVHANLFAVELVRRS
jgi:hypothetical protein